MGYVVVERLFEEPLDLDFEALKKRAASCPEAHRVRYLRAYVSSDRRRMVCIFEATDAETVRVLNRHVGVPMERAWAATFHRRTERPERDQESGVKV